MTARLHRIIAVDLEEPSAVDLSRLDDDGGARRRSEISLEPPRSLERTVRVRDDRFETPMIPGAREPGMLTTFGQPAVILGDSPITMDTATIAARQREGGGAPSERRPTRERSRWKSVRQALCLLVGIDKGR